MMAVLTVFPLGAVAQSCSARVIFANGIVTLEEDAQRVRDTLRDNVNQALQAEGRAELPFYCFDYAYASTREQTDTQAYLLDLLEAAGQYIGGVFGPFWRWLAGTDSPPNFFGQLVQDVFIGVGNISFLTNSDLQTQIGYYRSWLENSDKVIIVAHSQGNLFANEAFVVLTSGADGNSIVSPDRLPIVAVATPDSFVAGKPFGSHTTLYGDIIRSVLIALPANTDVDGTPCTPITPESQLPDLVNGTACHDFVKSYLAGDFSWPRIINQIISEIPVAIFTLTPSRDIWTTSVYSYAPSGGGPGGGLNDDLLRVGGWGDEYRSLLQFSLVSAPTNAVSATLRLYDISANSGTPVSMYLDRITSSWDWTTQLISPLSPDNERLWWVNRPSFIQISTSPLSAPTVGNYYDINITDLYNQWRSGAVSNYGVQLRPTSTHNEFNVFASSENATAAWRPQLIVVGSDE